MVGVRVVLGRKRPTDVCPDDRGSFDAQRDRSRPRRSDLAQRGSRPAALLLLPTRREVNPAVTPSPADAAAWIHADGGRIASPQVAGYDVLVDSALERCVGA